MKSRTGASRPGGGTRGLASLRDASGRVTHELSHEGRDEYVATRESRHVPPVSHQTLRCTGVRVGFRVDLSREDGSILYNVPCKFI